MAAQPTGALHVHAPVVALSEAALPDGFRKLRAVADSDGASDDYSA
jgi:hypothetical protein